MEKSALRFASDGDYGLLIFTVPPELAALSEEVLTYAFPVCKRRGGLLLALPLAAMNSDVLIDHLQRDDAGLVGPSKAFSKPLLVEDDDGNVVVTTSVCRFLVVDFEDAVLAFLQDYDTFDPDTAGNVIPFNVDQPSGVPSADGLVDEVKQWAMGENVGRANFYSAREEQEEEPTVKSPAAKGVPKKAAQKRMSNAAIMEQVSQLAAAVQALTAKQAEMAGLQSGSAAQASASHAPEPQPGGVRNLASPKMPGVAESLGLGLGAKGQPVDHFQKALSLVGPPPKVKTFQTQENLLAGPVEEEPQHWSSPPASSDPMLNAMAQQSHALTALVAHFTNSRPHGRTSRRRGTRAFLSYSWRSEKREASERFSNGKLQLLFASGSTNAQEALSLKSCSLERGRGGSIRSIASDISGAFRRVPPSAGEWTSDVDHRSRLRCTSEWEFAESQRTYRPAGLCHRASIYGQRFLGHCVPPLVERRPSFAGLSGQDDDDAQPREAFHSLGSKSLVCRGASLPQRDRNIVKQEDGSQTETKGQTRFSGCFRQSNSFPQAEVKIPQEACEVASSRSVKGSSCIDRGTSPFDSEMVSTQQNSGAFCPSKETSSIKGPPNDNSRSSKHQDLQLSHSKWCARLFTMVLRSRTPFARFLVQSIKAPRSNVASAPSLFPVPVLFGDHLGRMPSSFNRRQRARIHLARATHAIVMALNYVHCGSSIDQSLLGRELSPLHYRVYRNVKSFLKTEVSTEPFLVPSAGRRFPQLDARLNELSSVVTNLGLSGSPYSRAFPGTEVPADNTVCDELEPYRSLDASRLSLVGQGHWDCSTFLDDSLILPFRDPDFLLTSRVPGFGDAPCLNDRPEEVAALAKKWDRQGLLLLHKEPVIQHHRVKVFNCFKNSEKDRQIGDRRGRNFSEQALRGPSSWLPARIFASFSFVPKAKSYLFRFLTERIIIIKYKCRGKEHWQIR